MSENNEHLPSQAVNTGAHEHMISDACKTIAGALLDMTVTAVNKASATIEADPLSAEKYLHVADQMTLMVLRLYDVGEKSRVTAHNLYRQPDKRSAT